MVMLENIMALCVVGAFLRHFLRMITVLAMKTTINNIGILA